MKVCANCKARYRHEQEATDSQARTLVVEDSWAERVELLRKLVDQAYPEGDAPHWIPDAIQQLQQDLDHVRKLRRQRTHYASEVARHEEEVRQMRLRIGNAIDALAQNQAHVLEHHTELQRRLHDAQDTRGLLVDPLVELWQSLPAAPRNAKDLRLGAAQTLARAGEMANWWLDAERKVTRLHSELEALEQKRAEFQRQIDELKEQLESVNAWWDNDSSGLKTQAERIDHELNDRIDGLVRHAEPVVRHFLAFPGLRERILGGAAPPGDRAAASSSAR